MEATQDKVQEKIFFQDTNVTITQARFVANGTTYAMRNISSVRNFKIVKSRTLPYVLMGLGAIVTVLEGSRLFGIVLLAIGILILYLIKDEYSVRITTNAGEADGFISKDSNYIQNIVNALNDAVIHRG